MLKIVINDQLVDNSGIRINLNLKSPFPFNPSDDKIEGSFVFGAKFPASDTNKNIFNFPHRIEKFDPDETNEFSGTLSFDGRFLYYILISITEVTNRYFNTNIKIGAGYFGSLITDLSLKDVDYGLPVSLGSTTQDVIDHADDAVTKSYPQVNHNFPKIYNPFFYEDADPDERKIAPEYDDFINQYIHGTGFPLNIYNSSGIFNKYNLVPMPYLMFVMNRIFTTFGYQADGPFFNDTELQTLWLFNNYALDLITKKYFLKAEKTSQQTFTSQGIVIFNDESSGDNEDEDSCFDPITSEYTIQEEGYHNIQADLTMVHDTATAGDEGFYYIFIYLDNVVKHTVMDSRFDSNQFDETISYYFYFQPSDVGKKITVQVLFQNTFNNNPSGRVLSGVLTVSNVSKSSVNIYKKEIDYKNHVPDVGISSFLNAVQKSFGLVLGFDHSKKEVKIDFLENIIDQITKNDLSDKAVISSRKIKRIIEKGYIIRYTFGSNDDYTQDNFISYDAQNYVGAVDKINDLVIPDGINKIALVKNLNALYIYAQNEDDPPGWRFFSDNYYPKSIGDGSSEVSLEAPPLMMYVDGGNNIFPKISQLGSSEAFGIGNNEFDLHFMFYRTFLNYPFASSTIYDSNGNVVGNYAMRLDGSDGLYEQFLKKYYEWLINREKPLEIKRNFTSSDIRNLDLLLKQRVININTLIKSVKIPLTESKIGAATMELYKA